MRLVGATGGRCVKGLVIQLPIVLRKRTPVAQTGSGVGGGEHGGLREGGELRLRSRLLYPDAGVGQVECA